MRAGERQEAIFPDVKHGGIIQVVRRRQIKRDFVMKIARIDHGKNLSHGCF